MRRKITEPLEYWYEYNIDLDSRTLWIGSVKTDGEENESGVDYALVENVLKGLHLLECSGPAGDKPITIMLNNPGGDVIEGLAIYDAIRTCKNHVTIKICGKAWSMAGYILQAADERQVAKNASFMLHEGTRSLGTDHVQNIKRWSKYCDRLDEQCFEIYYQAISKKHPTFTRKRLRDMLKFDTILSATEVVDLGLADKIIE